MENLSDWNLENLSTFHFSCRSVCYSDTAHVFHVHAVEHSRVFKLHGTITSGQSSLKLFPLYLLFGYRSLN